VLIEFLYEISLLDLMGDKSKLGELFLDLKGEVSFSDGDLVF